MAPKRKAGEAGPGPAAKRHASAPAQAEADGDVAEALERELQSVLRERAARNSTCWSAAASVLHTTHGL
jgi:hypothetical protein